MSEQFDLKALRQVGNEACRAACEDSEKIGGAVNWARLGCTSAERCEDDEGDITYRLFVRKADPSASQLHKYLYEYLAGAGYPSVEVITEW